MVGQWIKYTQDWFHRYNTNTNWADEFNGGNNAYWEQKKSVWKELVHVAKWYANWPTSSIAAERVFASARTITTATRGSQSEEAFEKELKLKINQSMLHEELASCLNIVQNATL